MEGKLEPVTEGGGVRCVNTCWKLSLGCDHHQAFGAGDSCVVAVAIWLCTTSRTPVQHVLSFQSPTDELRGVTPAILRVHLQNCVQGQGAEKGGTAGRGAGIACGRKILGDAW